MTFPSASSGSSGDPYMVSLAKNAVRTRFALTTFLSAGGEGRLTNVRDLLRQVIQSAQECGLAELAVALSHSEETLSSDGAVATMQLSAIDSALRALAPRATRPRVAETRLFDEAAGAKRHAETFVSVAPPAVMSASAAPAALDSRLGSPLELVLQATESASFAKSVGAELDAAPFEVDDSDTDVDDAPVFEHDLELARIRRAAVVLSLTPPPVSVQRVPLLHGSTLTPPPHDASASGSFGTDAACAPSAMVAESDAVTAVLAPVRPSAVEHGFVVGHSHEAAFVSAQALERVASDEVFFLPPSRSRSDREEAHRETSALATPFDRVRAAYLVIAILLGLLLGFAARTMLEAGAFVPLHAASALLVAPGIPS